jgi:recombinational DNA repair ATPase RecF
VNPNKVVAIDKLNNFFKNSSFKQFQNNPTDINFRLKQKNRSKQNFHQISRNLQTQKNSSLRRFHRKDDDLLQGEPEQRRKKLMKLIQEKHQQKSNSLNTDKD